MAGILGIAGQEGLTAYANIISLSSGDIWNGTSFEAITGANVATYDVAVTETALKGLYKANFPSAITAGAYLVVYRAQGGGTPATTDTVIGQDKGVWDGSSWHTGLSFTETQKSEINAELLDVVSEDVISELSSVPDAEPTMRQAIMLVYMWLRNNSTATANSRTLRNSAGTAIATATLSDDGSTFQQGKLS